MPVRVRVRNFQSLEDITVTIDGLTVVTGTNNAGKSALFRAIQGVFTNRTGSNFVRHGAKSCTVELTFEDNQTLIWEKGKGVNRYVVNGKVFDNVGHGVPPEVAVFGVVPVTLSEDRYWPQIAPQIRGVNFLLDKPGSVMAEAVADVERVNQLNRALKFCESDRKKARASLRIRREDARDLKTKLAKYEGVDALATEISDLTSRLEGAAKIRGLHESVETLRGNRNEGLAAVASLSGIENVQVTEDDRLDKLQKIRDVLTQVRGIQRRLALRNRELVEAEAIGGQDLFALTSIPVQNAEKLQSGLRSVLSDQRRLLKSKHACDSLEREVREAEAAHQEAHDLVHEALGDLQECPACGRATGV